MWNLIKMEFSTLQLNIDKKYMLLIAIVPLIAFRFLKSVELEAFYIMLSYSFTYLISAYTIGIEKPESHYLINSFPISKSKVVLGKYIFIHLCLLFAWLYLAVYIVLMKTAGIIIIKSIDINYLYTAMLLMILILNFISIFLIKPGFFARLIYGMSFTLNLWFLTDFEVINRLSKYKMYILIFSILSIAISLALSIYLYNKREFARR